MPSSRPLAPLWRLNLSGYPFNRTITFPLKLLIKRIIARLMMPNSLSIKEKSVVIYFSLSRTSGPTAPQMKFISFFCVPLRIPGILSLWDIGHVSDNNSNPTLSSLALFPCPYLLSSLVPFSLLEIPPHESKVKAVINKPNCYSRNTQRVGKRTAKVLRHQNTQDRQY